MNDWFEWNGERCTDDNYGIHVSEQPPIIIPKERVDQVTIPGRPGTVTITEGDDVYEDITLTAKCWLSDPKKIPTIATWLKGSGKLTFANREGGFYYARLAEPIEFNRIMRGRQHMAFEISFLCSPFWYESDVRDIVINATNNSISYRLASPCPVFTEPVLTITGSGSITMMVGDTTVNIDGLSGSVVLDCEAGIAYTVNNGIKSFAGELVSLEDGEWPRLEPNTYNMITAMGINGGTISSITVKPNWRYL